MGEAERPALSYSRLAAVARALLVLRRRSASAIRFDASMGCAEKGPVTRGDVRALLRECSSEACRVLPPNRETVENTCTALDFLNQRSE